MGQEKLTQFLRIALMLVTLNLIGGLFFMFGFTWSQTVHAAPSPRAPSKSIGSKARGPKAKVTYAAKTELEFEGAQIEGEIRNPGDFYFQHRPDEKFDSLVKRRKNFHREILRDVVFSK